LSPESAPVPAERAKLRHRGSSQGGLRQYNERVVLQAIRLNGPLAGAEIARLTHLTAQTVSMITKQLLEDGLLLKGAPVRGKVGQPSVPLALNPDGASAIGIKVGRRSLDVLRIDFTGAVRARSRMEYPVPDPALLLPGIRERIEEVQAGLGAAERARIAGVGIAAPLSLGGWGSLLGMPDALARAWHAIDLRAEVRGMVDCPVALLKDTAAASVAELIAGRGRAVASFLYLFVDTFIGGGLVLDNHLRGGLHGNAGAVGSMPSGLAGDAPPRQLLAIASLINLEQRYRAAGLDVDAAIDGRALTPPWRPATDLWLAEAANGIALAAQSACCLLDLDAVIIDGSFSRGLQIALRTAIEAQLDRYDWEGVARPRILAGEAGPDARALGGALLPLYLEFAPDRDLFLKIVEDPA